MLFWLLLAFAVGLALVMVAARATLARHDLAVELEAVRAAADEDRLRSALLSSISHDLRSPLTSMIGAATSLDDALPAAARKELVDTIVSEGRRLDRYIQNLLDMTRLGQGPLRLRRDWIGLDEIVAAAVRRLRQAFPDVAVEVSVPAEPVLLHVHPALVEQALFNVLENAARYTPRGAGIRVRAREEPGAIVLDVVDSGPGIPEAERARVFEMFYRVEGDGSGSPGSGLGLAICRGMIRAHQGSVEALAGDGGAGTTIRIRLPRPAAPPMDDAAS